MDSSTYQDWTVRYNFWSKWEGVEELNQIDSIEGKSKFDCLKDNSFMGHFHDHTEGN